MTVKIGEAREDAAVIKGQESLRALFKGLYDWQVENNKESSGPASGRERHRLKSRGMKFTETNFAREDKNIFWKTSKITVRRLNK